MSAFPFYKQLDAMDCGPTCLRMVAKYYGKHFTVQTLREKAFLTRQGVSLLGIAGAAESIGINTIGVTISWEKLVNEAPLPAIVHWKQNHFIVVYKIKGKKVYVADPGYGLLTLTKSEFLRGWLSTAKDGEEKGVALLLKPSPDFFQQEDEKIKKTGFRFLFKYLSPYKKYLFQLIVGLLLGGIIQLILPFLFQSIVDFGITNQDLPFIYLVMIFQFMLILSSMGVDFIRRWILLHLSTRVNITLISDFLIKLMKLPVGFFDTKLTGDLLQRIGDHKRIESFLTSSSLNVLFSMVNLIIFSVVLGIYSLKILAVFLAGALLYFIWIYVFLKKRKEIDNRRFSKQSENQSKLIQIISGIKEIKLNNAERQKRWEWEHIQASLFNTEVKGLTLTQYQEAGGVFINETKNIIINVMAAVFVLNGNLTLGMMLAISYILGQLNGPVEQMINFLHKAQDAKISLERLGEIHQTQDESDSGLELAPITTTGDIQIRDLSFTYPGPLPRYVLQDINLHLPADSVTAIVGMSGSGKTTLLKLLLSFYQTTKGEIRIGDRNIMHISPDAWRSHCGVVMQDGFIFSDTIAGNIALGDEEINKERLLFASKIACINEFIDQLPMGFNTKIGQEGLTLSGGEKQRILIARAVYKDPAYLFLDEASSSLDANNELQIMRNLEEIFKGKTVIIVAHRLSTVKNADNIIVLDKGRIVEEGPHDKLISKKGAYYNLIKNQLELGT